MEKLFFPLILAVILELSFTVQVGGNAEFDPCQSANHKPLSSADRSSGNADQTSAKCDRLDLNAGWYRFTGEAGNTLSQSCPPEKRCGTDAPGWFNGTHPTVVEGVVPRMVCYHWLSNCCRWRNNIKVKNCGAFYVYELQKPPVCRLRYCASEILVVSVSKFSDLRQGDNVTLFCNVTKGQGSQTKLKRMSWYRDGTLLQTLQLPVLSSSGETLGTLVVKEEGNYTCVLEVLLRNTTAYNMSDYSIIRYYPVCIEEMLEGVTWSNTSSKEIDFKPCPNGKRGTTSRKCSAEGIWNKANFTDCSSEDFNKLNDAMEAIMKGEQSDLSAQQVLSRLAYASQPVKHNPLSTPEINKTELLIGVNILVKLAEYNNKTGNVSSIEDFQHFAQVASNLLESTNKRTWQELDKAGQGRSQFLVKAMEDYGLRVAATLNESTASRVVQRKNLKIRIDIVGENSPLRDRGLKVAYNQSSIYLPPPLFRSPQDIRVVTVIYLTLHEVLSLPREGKDESHQTASANTTIVSSTLSPRPPDVLSNSVKILLRNQKMHRKLRVPINGKCVFWRPGEVARWSTSGCRLVRSESNASVTTCECDHLTIFAALMDPYGTSPPSKPLEIISIVGCSISLIAVVITIFMYLISWKAIKRSGGRIGVKVLLHLCTALAVSCALVIFEGSARNKTWCLVVAVLLHYFLLALFSWMLCEGVLHYLVVVKLTPGDEAEDKFKYFCIFGWGFPAIVVATSLGVTQTNGYGDSVCWLDVKTGLIWAFLGPALLVICINIVVYVKVLRCMAGSPEAQRMRNTRKERSRVKASIVLLPLFGISWLFGLMSFSSETILFKYLFAIFNSLQGLMIFVLHCARNKILRDTVKRQFRLTSQTKAKQRDKPASTKAIKRSRNENCEYELEPQTAESRSSAQILDTTLRQEDENSGNDGDDRDEHVQPLSDG